MDPAVEAVLDEYVRPALAAHGGGVGDCSFQDGVFRFRILGACALCPSAWMTAKQLVTDQLITCLPQVKAVIMEQGVSRDLQEQAKALLRERRSAR